MKKKLSKNDIYCIIIFTISITGIIINRAINGFGNILWIADFGSIFGVLYSIFATRHSILMHVFNFISTIFIATTSLLQHIYFNAVFCFAVSAPLILLGIINWKRNDKKDKNKNLKALSKRGKIIFPITLIAVLPVIMVVLWKLNSNLFYLDAINTSLCFIGLMLSSQMYYEQFYVFLVANIVGIVMNSILCTQNLNNIVYVLMNIVYFISTIISIINWKKLYSQQQNSLQEGETEILQSEEIGS